MIGKTNESSRKTWLKKSLNALPSGLRILDAGAGELANKQFCSHLDYVSQDFCQYEGVGDSKGLQHENWDTKEIDLVCDINCIPEKDASFDVVLCSEVLEHLPSPEKALTELSRLLKKGGILILTAPFCSLTHFAPYHFSTGFNRYYYEYHLNNLGFNCVEISSNGNYFEYLAQETRRVVSTGDKYASQKASLIERFAIKVVLKMLERFSKNDKQSDELLCFGYHVMATKNT